MNLPRIASCLCSAIVLSFAALQVHAQARPASKADAPTVPEIVEEAYRYGDFAELERLYAVYGKAGVRSELTGTPRLRHFWDGIGKVGSSSLRVADEYYQQMDALTLQWASEHPQSVLAQLLHAHALMTHAWAYRGGGYANTVSPAAWAGFRKYLDLAMAQLRRSEALAAKDSSWNELVLDVGRGLGWNRNQLLPAFEAGLAKNPDDDELYFRMQTALLPKWGGDLDSVDRLISLATRNTRDKRGLEMYARLYAALSYSEVHQALFTSTHASWVSMKAGFEDQLKRYPHVDNRNKYAYFACMANDRSTLKEQLELIGDKFERIFWGDNPERTFEMCKSLAQQV
jgi:hypothetical protein